MVKKFMVKISRIEQNPSKFSPLEINPLYSTNDIVCIYYVEQVEAKSFYNDGTAQAATK